MNAIMDLTAHAVSFITAAQTTILKGCISLKEENEEISILNLQSKNIETFLKECIELEKQSEEDTFRKKSIDLVWISRQAADDETIIEISKEYATFLCINLKKWIDKNWKKGFDELKKNYGIFPTPFNWRDTISKILYTYCDTRIELATTLEYLPIQIVLALGEGQSSARKQRVLQTWNIEETYKSKLLNKKEIKWVDDFKENNNSQVEKLLKNDHYLIDTLKQNDVPLSFEQVFSLELNEIEENRDRRVSEQHVATTEKPSHKQAVNNPATNDPYEKARQMGGLNALAFSGGGIRSATFNLGILQGFASKNLITEFDYLSTVSGGGYIGSWLAAWIKREGSVVKVSNRLCPGKSPDPLGEELRPIKWLRMFSNYFAPDASVMSADAWTVGVTWLRNTLLNQIIIFFMLLSVLFFGELLFVFWSGTIKGSVDYSIEHVFIYSLTFLAPVALLAGLGMHAYHSERVRLLQVKREHTNTISGFILAIGFMGAFFISGWLSSEGLKEGAELATFASKLNALWPAALILLCALILVGWLGNYTDCIRKFLKRKFLAGPILVITCILTTLISLFCICVAWTLLRKIDSSLSANVTEYKNEIEFILGFPMVLEVFSITLVARMAFLGRFFPDERREWWGRMGAYIHRTSFLWILISASALLGLHYFKIISAKYLPVGITAWVALVSSAVKAAFNSKMSGSEKSTSSFSTFLNILGLLGPYLFALGLLIFLPGLIKPICSLVERRVFHNPQHSTCISEIAIICIVLVCFSIALLLSMQVGVNEFSMHHFYRNRLVRAYLGATRRDAERRKTVNPFTGFDMRDDEKLSEMKNKYGYYGPYPILNTALNASQVTDLARQDRKAESFIFSPLFCGFDFSMAKASTDTKIKSYDYAYKQTETYAFKDNGPGIGTAMAISGAAVNPNHGYHSSAATAFLLTVFNIQMGWWIGNPRKSTCHQSEPRFGLGYIFSNLVGKTNTRSNYVALSDGGHFDNMGLYELIRRRCATIVLCDAEQDDDFTCEGFANAIRRCRIDFGADINIDISKIVNRSEKKLSEMHYAVGNIVYAGGHEQGTLVYIKSSMTGDEPVDIYEYSKKSKAFPDQTTADQFFDEEQFESYRKLGLHIAEDVWGVFKK